MVAATDLTRFSIFKSFSVVERWKWREEGIDIRSIYHCINHVTKCKWSSLIERGGKGNGILVVMKKHFWLMTSPDGRVHTTLNLSPCTYFTSSRNVSHSSYCPIPIHLIEGFFCENYNFVPADICRRQITDLIKIITKTLKSIQQQKI